MKLKYKDGSETEHEKIEIQILEQIAIRTKNHSGKWLIEQPYKRFTYHLQATLFDIIGNRKEYPSNMSTYIGYVYKWLNEGLLYFRDKNISTNIPFNFNFNESEHRKILDNLEFTPKGKEVYKLTESLDLDNLPD